MDLDFAEVRTMVFSTLVVAQLVHAVNVRSGTEPRLVMPRPALVVAIAVSATLQVFIIYTDFGHKILQTASLTATGILVVLVASALSMVGVRLFNRKLGR
jgi:magnesium-transporting ATPase (P-type)